MKNPSFSILFLFPDPAKSDDIGTPEVVLCPHCGGRLFTDYVVCEGVIAVTCPQCGRAHNLSDLFDDYFGQS